MPAAWCLNLDADAELASPARYQRRASVQRQVEAHLASCSDLCRGEPVVGKNPVAPGYRVFCWCPTPSALEQLDRRGLHAVRGPDVGVLRTVNHRRFLLSLSPTLEGRRFLHDELPDPALFRSGDGGWRLKRPFGFAGRGQRTVRGELSKDDQRWIADSIRLGGLFMEPAVDIVAEFSLHGLLRQSRLLVGKTCRFHTDAWGAPETMVVAEPERVRDSALVETLERVAEGLARAGYFGPLGIDAYYWRHHESTRFNSLGELNARFTLAWSLGMGSARDAALELYAG